MVKLKQFKDKVDKSYYLKDLRTAESLISTITLNNLNDEVWLKQLRCSVGYLRDSIRELEKEVKNG